MSALRKVRQVVHLYEGAITEVVRILHEADACRVFFVVDELAYSVSGAEAVLESHFAGRSTTRFSGFEMNPKLDDVERGVELYRMNDPEIVVALGGGTAIDLGKLIRAAACHDDPAHAIVTGSAQVATNGPPLVAIPTTAGTGSEATHFAVVYLNGEKHSVAHNSLTPDYAIVDSELTHSLPTGITAATGLDAFCQAVESIWAVGATEQSIAYAIESVRLSSEHLVNATCNPTDRSCDARQAMAKASHLAGKAINISKTTAPHALSYSITSQFDVPHGMAVALSLSPMLAYNSQVTAEDCQDPRGPSHVCERIELLLELLGVDNVPAGCHRIERLISAVGCPNSLRQAGISTNVEVQGIVDTANASRMANNPRKATPETLFKLFTDGGSSFHSLKSPPVYVVIWTYVLRFLVSAALIGRFVCLSCVRRTS